MWRMPSLAIAAMTEAIANGSVSSTPMATRSSSVEGTVTPKRRATSPTSAGPTRVARLMKAVLTERAVAVARVIDPHERPSELYTGLPLTSTRYGASIKLSASKPRSSAAISAKVFAVEPP